MKNEGENRSGEHPIFMEDGWDPGTMHLQLHNGVFDLSINGVGESADCAFGVSSMGDVESTPDVYWKLRDICLQQHAR